MSVLEKISSSEQHHLISAYLTLSSLEPRANDQSRQVSAELNKGVSFEELQDRARSFLGNRIAHIRFRTPSEVRRCLVTELGVNEDWLELGELAAFISIRKAQNDPIGIITHSDLAQLQANVNGNIETGYYLRPRIELFSHRLASNPLVTVIDNLIANGIDAENAKRAKDKYGNIGMFASGVKSLLRFIQTPYDEVTVLSKKVGEDPQNLRIRTDGKGRFYLNISGITVQASASESFTQVTLKCGDLSEAQICDALPQTAFSAGIINGVKVDIQGTESKPERSKRYPSHHLAKQPAGHVRMSFGKGYLTIIDRGIGMNREELYCMFLPRQGTKNVSIVQSSEVPRIVGTNCYIETTCKPDNQSTLVLSRRGEALKRIKNTEPQFGLFPGDVIVELDVLLRPAGESRAQGDILLDDNIKVAIPMLIAEVLKTTEPVETKAQIINTIIKGLSAYANEGDQADSPLSGATCRIVKETTKAIAEAMSNFFEKESKLYAVVPTEASFQRIKHSSGKPLLPVAKEVLLFTQAYQLHELGTPLYAADNIETNSGFSAYLVDLATSDIGPQNWLLKTQALEKVASHPEAHLPVVIDTYLRNILIDRTLWHQFKRLEDQYRNDPANTLTKHQYLCAVAAFNILLNTKVQTNYELPGIHSLEQQAQIRPVNPQEKKHKPFPDITKLTKLYPVPRDVGVIVDNLPLTQRLEAAAIERIKHFFAQTEILDAINVSHIETIAFTTWNNQELAMIYTGSKFIICKTDRGGYYPLEVIDIDGLSEPKEYVRNNELHIFSHSADLQSIHHIVCRGNKNTHLSEIAFEERIPERESTVVEIGGKLYLAHYNYDYEHRKCTLKIFKPNEQGAKYVNADIWEPNGEAYITSVLAFPGSTSESGYLYVCESRTNTKWHIFKLNNAGKIEQKVLNAVTGVDVQQANAVTINGQSFIFTQDRTGHLTNYRVNGAEMSYNGAIGQLTGYIFDPNIVVRGDTVTITDHSKGYTYFITFDKQSQEFNLKRIWEIVPQTQSSSDHRLRTIWPINQEQGIFGSSFSYRGLTPLHISGNDVRIIVNEKEYAYRNNLVQRLHSIIQTPLIRDYDLSELINFCLAFDDTTERRISILEKLTLLPAQLLNYLHSDELRLALASDKTYGQIRWQSRVTSLIRAGFDNFYPRSKLDIEAILVTGSWGGDDRQIISEICHEINLNRLCMLTEDRLKVMNLLANVARFGSKEHYQTIQHLQAMRSTVKALVKNNKLMHIADKFDIDEIENLYPKNEELSQEQLAYILYLQGRGEQVREWEKPLHLPSNVQLNVSGLAYLAKVRGFRSLSEMQQFARSQRTSLAELINGIANLAEFDKEWQIAVYFGGSTGIEQRELVQNAHDAIRRRASLLGDITAGIIDYDFSIGEINNTRYLIQKVTDNGYGMTDYGRLCFAVSGLSDKHGQSFNQSGEYGIGFASCYRETDLVIVESVRMLENGRKSRIRDIYQVHKNATGYRERLIQIGAFEDIRIDQQSELGTQIFLCKELKDELPFIEVVERKTAARKYAWFTSVTSHEPYDIPVHIYAPHADDKIGQTSLIEYSAKKMTSRTLPNGKVVALYASNKGSLPQVALDGRWVTHLSGDMASCVHPNIANLIHQDNLLINTSGFTPTRDRGGLIDAENLPSIIGALLVEYASQKALRDTTYQPFGMPIDFRTNPDYTTSLLFSNRNLLRRMQLVNQRGYLSSNDIQTIRKSSTDDLNIILTTLEHNDQGYLTSIFAERTQAFVKAYTDILENEGSLVGAEYLQNIEQCQALARLIISDKLNAQLSHLKLDEWIQWAKSYIQAYKKMRRVSRQQIVTDQFLNTSDFYALKQILQAFKLHNIEIAVATPLGGLQLPNGMRLNIDTFKSNQWHPVVIHETAHHVENALNTVGTSSIFTHQQEGPFALAMRLSAWRYLSRAVREY